MAMCRRYRHVFQVCSSNAFGSASPPVSLKPSRPRPLPGARDESTAISESLRAVERVLGKKPGALSISELSHAPVRVDEGRLADSQTGGLELLSLCGDSAIVLPHCADSRSGKSMGRISGGVFQICSRAIRARVAGDLRTGSSTYGRGTANKMWMSRKWGWRGCLRRCAGKSSSDGIAMQSQYRLSALAMPRQWRSRELFVECSSSPFGLACPPVSLKPSRPRRTIAGSAKRIHGHL
jgi:hypothetical protein